MLGIPKKHLKCPDTAQFQTAFNPFIQLTHFDSLWSHDKMADR